jgi:CheY-like chemotaxis protein
MKTILKLGFKATAVWNGREALEYLTAAKEGKNEKPDIILMDVQMPVIDGYKFTHVLRHHIPYKAYVSDVPIVAMTASAIQGDKEKCQRAGMDDYLSKPVKSKTLEQMLVRWSVNRRREPTTPLPASEASNCSEPGEHCSNDGGLDGYMSPRGTTTLEEDLSGSLLTPRPLTGSGSAEPSQFPLNPDAVSPTQAAEPMQTIRRADTDELAMKSQKDKLMDAAGGAPGVALARGSAHQGGEALTEENVERLQELQDEAEERRWRPM